MIEASASAEFPMAVAFCHYFSFNDLEFDEWILLGTVQIGQCYGNGYGTAKDILPKQLSGTTKSVEQGNSAALSI